MDAPGVIALMRRAWAEDEQPVLPRRRSNGQGMGLPMWEQVAKAVLYAVLAPPDTAASVSKALLYPILVPPDNAASVSKALVYVVTEEQISPDYPRNRTVLQLLRIPDEFLDQRPRGRYPPMGFPYPPVVPTPGKMRQVALELAYADDGFAAHHYSPPHRRPTPPITSGVRHQVHLIDPRFITWATWSSQMGWALLFAGNLPQQWPEEDWAKWADYAASLPALAAAGAPRSHAYADWRDWVAAFNQSLGSVTY